MATAQDPALFCGGHQDSSGQPDLVGSGAKPARPAVGGFPTLVFFGGGPPKGGAPPKRGKNKGLSDSTGMRQDLLGGFAAVIEAHVLMVTGSDLVRSDEDGLED